MNLSNSTPRALVLHFQHLTLLVLLLIFMLPFYKITDISEDVLFLVVLWSVRVAFIPGLPG